MEAAAEEGPQLPARAPDEHGLGLRLCMCSFF